MGISYLSRAASSSAAVESAALSSGLKQGGAAKGELVLAIYELANSFRHGWGVEKDPVAARSYYETAANLGDTDAMNEVAKCYEDGLGGKKDRVSVNVIVLVYYSLQLARFPVNTVTRSTRPGTEMLMPILFTVHSSKVLSSGGEKWEQDPRKYLVCPIILFFLPCLLASHPDCHHQVFR